MSIYNGVENITTLKTELYYIHNITHDNVSRIYHNFKLKKWKIKKKGDRIN